MVVHGGDYRLIFRCIEFNVNGDSECKNEKRLNSGQFSNSEVEVPVLFTPVGT